MQCESAMVLVVRYTCEECIEGLEWVEMWMGGIKEEEEGIKEERGLGSKGRWVSSVASLLLLVGHLFS